ncbi:microfibril-associated glycoprotein 4-like [Watersipora subatra]|uniref:microfibril-associated glycoprotein 4-like n=1 Tax=Watersipora subatra TaxID=2589382 RepID=UPI00355C1FBA
MGMFFELALVFTLIIAGNSSYIGPQSNAQELFVYNEKIYIAHKLLQDECPELIRTKRNVESDSLTSVDLETAKIVLSNLLKTVIECRSKTSKVDGVTKPSLGATGATSQRTNLTTTATKQPTTPMPAAKVTMLTMPASEKSTTLLPAAKDCQEHYEQGATTSGVYLLDLPSSNFKPFEVWCDFFDGHGWTVFQKRFDGSVDFYKDWFMYKDGFGNASGEYWLGLNKLHILTQTNRRLNILVKSANETTKSGTWSSFITGSERNNYKLNVSSVAYNGSLTSSGLSINNGMAFSTADRDHDIWSGYNCAALYHGAWWYKNCGLSNLNGGYHKHGLSEGVYWTADVSLLKETVMRVSRDKVVSTLVDRHN